MNSLRIVACLLLPVVAHAEQATPTVADLAWIAGCWGTGEGGDTVSEHWMSPSGQMMLGMSHTVADGKTVAFEFLRIHEEADGIYYTANPLGQAPNSFKLVKSSSGEVVFEDPDHEFPQRIIYRLDKDGGLAATIVGTSKGALKQIEYPMRRVPCE